MQKYNSTSLEFKYDSFEFNILKNKLWYITFSELKTRSFTSEITTTISPGWIQNYTGCRFFSGFMQQPFS